MKQIKYRLLPNLDTLMEHFKIVPVNQLGVDSGLVWIKPRIKCIKPGDIAGGLSSHSKQERHDWKVSFDYKRYYVSRVIYALHHGIDPGPLTVDHIDQNPLNNSIENLELVDRAVQNKNRRLFKNNTSGVRGVSWSEHQYSWSVQIHMNGKPVRIGTFTCKIEAAIAYNEALKKECKTRYENLCNKVENIQCNCRICTNVLSENTSTEADQ